MPRKPTKTPPTVQSYLSKTVKQQLADQLEAENLRRKNLGPYDPPTRTYRLASSVAARLIRDSSVESKVKNCSPNARCEFLYCTTCNDSARNRISNAFERHLLRTYGSLEAARKEVRFVTPIYAVVNVADLTDGSDEIRCSAEALKEVEKIRSRLGGSFRRKWKKSAIAGAIEIEPIKMSLMEECSDKWKVVSKLLKGQSPSEYGFLIHAHYLLDLGGEKELSVRGWLSAGVSDMHISPLYEDKKVEKSIADCCKYALGTMSTFNQSRKSQFQKTDVQIPTLVYHRHFSILDEASTAKLSLWSGLSQ